MTIELQISSTTLLYSTKQWQLSKSLLPSKKQTISVEKVITNILKGKGIKAKHCTPHEARQIHNCSGRGKLGGIIRNFKILLESVGEQKKN